MAPLSPRRRQHPQLRPRPLGPRGCSRLQPPHLRCCHPPREQDLREHRRCCPRLPAASHHRCLLRGRSCPLQHQHRLVLWPLSEAASLRQITCPQRPLLSHHGHPGVELDPARPGPSRLHPCGSLVVAWTWRRLWSGPPPVGHHQELRPAAVAFLCLLLAFPAPQPEESAGTWAPSLLWKLLLGGGESCSGPAASPPSWPRRPAPRLHASPRDCLLQVLPGREPRQSAA
mmetsp:Transcript_18209/g.53196  ORF Transcript_18209/g.53196 Transcript_18209/m.53196 type:complete len:229 (+) Transcript_18209:1124-1810(+)